MRGFLSRLFGPPPAPPAPPPSTADYKAAWNVAAAGDAHDAILTGASAEEFETSGRSDMELIARFLPPGRRAAVLNIGCGVGRVERYLAPRVGELWAVDVSGEMLRKARERLAGLPNVHLREVGNREYLAAFEGDRFDLVFSLLVLQHLEREDAFCYLREARRVLKPGGVLVTQFPNYLSATYTRAFIEGVDVPERSPGRVRVYTEAEIRRTLAVLELEIADLWFGGHHGAEDEIYVAARKPV
jgi:SAM-dependent methyltransferase